MSEDEKQLVKKFKNLYIKDFNNEHITSNDRLSYIECALLTELIEKLEKELQQEKEKNEKLVDKTIQYDKTLEKLQKDTIWKDKIRAKIKELEVQEDWYRERNSLDVLYGRIDELEELLKEN